jgi:hypothetical protein
MISMKTPITELYPSSTVHVSHVALWGDRLEVLPSCQPGNSTCCICELRYVIIRFLDFHPYLSEKILPDVYDLISIFVGEANPSQKHVAADARLPQR